MATPNVGPKLNPIEHLFLKRFLLKYGVNIDTGVLDMSTIAGSILSFLSSPLAQTIYSDAEAELKTLITNFLKAHIKSATPAA
jgi:hypothetical protein